MFRNIGIDLSYNSFKIIIGDNYSNLKNNKIKEEYLLKHNINSKEYFLEVKNILENFIKEHEWSSAKLDILIPHNIDGVNILFDNIPTLKNKLIDKTVKNQLDEVYNRTPYKSIWEQSQIETTEDFDVYQLIITALSRTQLKHLAELKSLKMNINSIYIKPIPITDIVNNNIVIDFNKDFLSLYVYNQDTLLDIKDFDYEYEEVKTLFEKQFNEMKNKSFNINDTSTDNFSHINHIPYNSEILNDYEIGYMLNYIYIERFLNFTNNKEFLNFINMENSEDENVINDEQPTMDIKDLTFEEQLKILRKGNENEEDKDKDKDKNKDKNDINIDNPIKDINEDIEEENIKDLSDTYKEFLFNNFKDTISEKRQLVLQDISNNIDIKELSTTLDNIAQKTAENIQRYIRSIELDSGVKYNNIKYTYDDYSAILLEDVIISLNNKMNLNIEELKISETNTFDQHYFYSKLALEPNVKLKKLNFAKLAKKPIDFTSLGLVLLLSSLTFNAGVFLSNNSIDKKIDELSNITAEQNGKIGQLENLINGYNQQLNEEEIIINMADEISGQQKWLSEILYLLPSKTPKDLAIKNIDIEIDKIIIHGYAADYTNIGYFIMNLEEIGDIDISDLTDKNSEDVSSGHGKTINGKNKKLNRTFTIQISKELDFDEYEMDKTDNSSNIDDIIKNNSKKDD